MDKVGIKVPKQFHATPVLFINEQLSRCERLDLMQIAAGKTVGEIATLRGVSIKTVSTNIARMVRKTGVRNQAELRCVGALVYGTLEAAA